ncbi:hypothetical protein DLAC_05688 [Tieghemostelium lacteum]|uniref:N-lysine methyltransferase n=1 Tax=Tieghemostelium lacteum TaxID=361077 RepID=A0A151ZGM2_TIELA|nr:hypothetical protein DLAC_05688 [Tieghemostelium lacteum]|eukprot:KYQ93075.1 hypothetical protein DLAC_05688 [Tieghemostelium lacteum]
MGVKSLVNLELNKTVAMIPKNSILSIHTTAISNLLEQYKIKGSIGTVISLMYEKSIGIKSKWYGYIQSLPVEGVDLPVMWSLEDQSLFNGTSMEDILKRDKEQLECLYNDNIRDLLIPKHSDIFSGESFSYREYLIATSLVSSRAFNVDSYHGDSMVPLADIFNHRTLRENVHIESNGDVCKKCGSFYTCAHRKLKKSNSDILHDDNDNSDDEEFSKLFGKSSENQENLFIKIVKSCKSQTEVFNTYGDHDNTMLLSKYGFVEMDNPCDKIYLSRQEIDKIIMESIKDLSLLQQRLSFYSNLFDIDSRDDHHIDINGNVDDALVLSIGICCLDADRFKQLSTLPKSQLYKYFEKLQQDDILSQSPLTKDIILKILKQRDHSSSTTLEEMQTQITNLQPQKSKLHQYQSLQFKFIEKRILNKSIDIYR